MIHVHKRVFNHRPFVKGEANTFVKEFETKRKDREVENVFKVLEVTSELKDEELDKLRTLCDDNVSDFKNNVDAAQLMCDRILDQSRRQEIEQALESSRQARDKEWESFSKDIQNQRSRIDEGYKQKEEELKNQYKQLEDRLKH